MPADGQIDDPAVRFGPTVYQGEIFFPNGSGFELFREMLMGQGGFGNHQRSGRVFVQTVDDTGTDHISNTGKVRAMMEKRVHQGSRRVSRCRMNHHPLLFVDDQQVTIFKKDVDVDRLWLAIQQFRRWNGSADLITGSHTIARLFCRTVYQNILTADQMVDQGSGTLRQGGDDKGIHAFSRMGIFHQNCECAVTLHGNG